MSSSPTRTGWLAPLATAALFAFVVASPAACAKAIERAGGLGDDDGDETEETPTSGSGGAGGIDGYKGQTVGQGVGVGGAPSTTGPGSGGDPASSVAASSVAASSSQAAASSVASSAQAVSVAASSSSGGGQFPCCTVDIFPGCPADFLIESCVCFLDEFCCDTEWDDYCVDEVESFGCGTCS